jgi:hypothetical protein
MDAKLCIPDDDAYIIIESIHTAGLHKASVSTQVFRRVYGVCNTQDVYFNNKKLDRPLSGFELLKDFLSGGDLVRTEDSGEQRVITRYIGTRNYIKPVSDLNYNNNLSKKLSKDYFIGDLGKIFAYGFDPIPDVKLFGKPNISFNMPGDGAYPVAVVKYNKRTGDVEQILDPIKKKKIIFELVK